MDNSKQPSIYRLVGGLLFGLGAIAFSALILCTPSGHGFWPVFFALAGSLLFTGTILLVWLTRWALRDDGQISQFGIGTLLMLTGLAAVYLGFVQWLIDRTGPLENTDHTSRFIAVCIISAILLAISLIPLLSMAESLVWLATRMVRWGWVQKWLHTNPKRKRGES